MSPYARHIKFGDGLDVTDEGDGIIRVDGGGGGGGEGGIQFDTYPQEGGYLELSTTGSHPGSGAGIRLNTGTLGVVASEDIVMDVTAADGQFLITARQTTFYNVASGGSFSVNADATISLGAAGTNIALDATRLYLSSNSGDMHIAFPNTGGDLKVTAYVGTTFKDIFKITQAGYGGGSPTYHILTGATWVADL